MAQQPPSGPGPPYYRGFTITLRHTTLGRTPLAFEPTIPASEQPQTCALDHAATGIDRPLIAECNIRLNFYKIKRSVKKLLGTQRHVSVAIIFFFRTMCYSLPLVTPLTQAENHSPRDPVACHNKLPSFLLSENIFVFSIYDYKSRQNGWFRLSPVFFLETWFNVSF
jgi:hypothetical protein